MENMPQLEVSSLVIKRVQLSKGSQSIPVVIMKLKAQIMQILVGELPHNQIGAFYLMSLGVELPNTVTKTDLTDIICFLCKKLCWIEEEDVKVSTSFRKSSEENQENNLPKDSSVDWEVISGMGSIKDSWSDHINENSLALEESFKDTIRRISTWLFLRPRRSGEGTRALP